MGSLTRSLSALPPKQVLAWALAEKAKREKAKTEKAALILQHQNASELSAPQPLNVPSLVLDPQHPFSDLYYKKARYKVYWGGRGSAKSWAMAEALVRRAAAGQLKILCAREYQNSIKDSVHALLVGTIKRLGLEGWFTCTQESIRSKTGSEFIFKGLHNNENGIRSTHAIDICWVEEAHSVSESSWRSLLPTIRGDDAEIWISFNLMTEDDATFKRFVGDIEQQPWTAGSGVQALANPPRSRSIVWKVNYDSNPYFPEVLRQEMEDDRAADYHLYEHVWLGLPQKVSNAIIFNRKYVVREFDSELWRKADRLHFGLDFGFSRDPMALLRMFMLQEPKSATDSTIVRRLYVEYEVYGTGIEVDEMDEAIGSVPGVREWPIKADCSQPAMISHLTRLGYNCQPAEKWENCIKDGIRHIRGFHEIVVHPRCINVAREFRLYSYKVDPRQLDEQGQPQVLPIIVDAHNHAMDAMRYGLDGYVARGDAIGLWTQLGMQTQG